MQLSPLLLKNNLKINFTSRHNKQFFKFYRSTVTIDFIIKSIKDRYKLNKVNLAIPFLYCRSCFVKKIWVYLFLYNRIKVSLNLNFISTK